MSIKRIFLGLLVSVMIMGVAHAQLGPSSCSNQTPCIVANPAGGTTSVTISQATPGTTNGVVTNAGSVTATKPGTYTEVPLDVATTTTANTAVTALISGHRSAGGWIMNPATATTVICVNFLGTAAFSSGACVGSNNGLSPGVSIPIPPNANAVSVVSSDATHAFSGEGLQ